MSARAVLFFPGGTKPGLGLRIVSPADLNLDHGQAAETGADKRSDLIPYCLDFSGQHVYFTTGADPLAAAHAPFHHAYLREHALGFLRVPAEHLAPQPLGELRPVLLFSPGRCGSTALTKLLAAMGALSISEPDFYTQVAFHAAIRASKRLLPDQAARTMLARAGERLLAPFATSSTAPCVLKMRSQATFAPQEIMSAFPSWPRTLFIVRGFQAWCESRVRAFPDSLEENFLNFMFALQALRWLRGRSDCLCLDYEQIQNGGTDLAQRIADFLGLPKPSPETISAALATDSQQGTALERGRLARDLPQATTQAIARLWQTRAPRALLRELGLEHL
ncbi:hypothetical protein BURK2_00322 [Burkholderiales bacterium]|nr:MAG: hypothetical protein F9K47_07155 [Burkholderiales bacterium]CAG0953319.1 hypothetical protein BURK2_00322 [Burkholderiales bacterium]